MKSMVEKHSWNAPTREVLYAGEPLSVVGVCLDDETWRFLNLFANSSSLIRVRSQVGSSRGDHDPDSMVEQLGQPAPDACLVDFDRNRHEAVMIAERIHASLPGTAIFAVSSQSQPNAILEAMRCGCSEYLVKPIDRDQLVNAIVRIGARRQEKV